MHVSLHHIHLPRLQDTDFVEYDEATGVVRLLDMSKWETRCLDAVFESEQELASGRTEPTEFPSDEPN